jgi:hypothetical protein
VRRGCFPPWVSLAAGTVAAPLNDCAREISKTVPFTHPDFCATARASTDPRGSPELRRARGPASRVPPSAYGRATHAPSRRGRRGPSYVPARQSTAASRAAVPPRCPRPSAALPGGAVAEVAAALAGAGRRAPLHRRGGRRPWSCGPTRSTGGFMAQVLEFRRFLYVTQSPVGVLHRHRCGAGRRHEAWHPATQRLRMDLDRVPHLCGQTLCWPQAQRGAGEPVRSPQTRNHSNGRAVAP